MGIYMTMHLELCMMWKKNVLPSSTAELIIYCSSVNYFLFVRINYCSEKWTQWGNTCRCLTVDFRYGKYYSTATKVEWTDSKVSTSINGSCWHTCPQICTVDQSTHGGEESLASWQHWMAYRSRTPDLTQLILQILSAEHQWTWIYIKNYLIWVVHFVHPHFLQISLTPGTFETCKNIIKKDKDGHYIIWHYIGYVIIISSPI